MTQPRRVMLTGAVVALAVGCASGPAYTHHSYAAYTFDLSFGFVGVISRIEPTADHAGIIVAVVNAERTGYVYRQVRDPLTGELSDYLSPAGERVPVIWLQETGSSAALASEGITQRSLPPSSVVSLAIDGPTRMSLPVSSGVTGADTEGGALFHGTGRGTGNWLAVCPVSPETGRAVLPPPGAYCDDVPGASVHFERRAEDIEGAVEWAVWAFEQA